MRFVGSIAVLFVLLPAVTNAEEVLIPKIDGEWWQVAGDPDLGKYTTPKQQPVDFGIWQASDGPGRSGRVFAVRHTLGRPGCSIGGKARGSGIRIGSRWGSR